MEDNINSVIEANKDNYRKNLVSYTAKAFHMIPKKDRQRILDIGCGSGIVTVELAKICGGEIVGLDINKPSLKRLKKKAKEVDLSNQVKIVCCSLFKPSFQLQSFDILWVEGVIQIIGFENGLKSWRKFLKPKGFMVIHDETQNWLTKIKMISNCGFTLINWFLLPEDAWWREYYQPLEKKLKRISWKYKNQIGDSGIFFNLQKEINLVKQNPKKYNSMFYIMCKK
jgi:ubiquinone/menaquinone biosynthesis C-methylase UbiE